MDAKAVLNAAKDEADGISQRATALAERVGYWKGGHRHGSEERPHGLGCTCQRGIVHHLRVWRGRN
jgi:hypothetical protein